MATLEHALGKLVVTCDMSLCRTWAQTAHQAMQGVFQKLYDPSMKPKP